jgi:hypothetical protein
LRHQGQIGKARRRHRFKVELSTHQSCRRSGLVQTSSASRGRDSPARHRCLPRRAPALEGLCCYTGAYRPQSSRLLGRTLSHSRSTRWTPTNEWNSTSQKLVEEIENAALFLYAGDGHLCADNGLDDYDEEAAGLLKQRVLAFLERVG